MNAEQVEKELLRLLICRDSSTRQEDFRVVVLQALLILLKREHVFGEKK